MPSYDVQQRFVCVSAVNSKEELFKSAGNEIKINEIKKIITVEIL